MPHTADRDYPIYDTTLRLPHKCGNISIFGMISVIGASYENEPGIFQEEVDLGVNFTREPVVQLTEKKIHDDLGNVYTSGEHFFSYRWLDADHFSKFAIMTDSKVLNYPPSVAYTVTGSLRFFQRFLYCFN
ncbi:MAG: hypothetical protein ACC657_05300 [Thiohalomonadales bacterium]